MDEFAIQRVLRAAYQAGATDFIRTLPGGLGAPVGEQGAAISGGQRQSVALARALLHDPEVLILDEPTSNMDKVTEKLLRSRLAKLVQNKTLVLITHRASLLTLVNRIIIIDQGRVVADGPRDEVLEAIRSQKPQSQMFSASATRDHKNATQANTATEHNAGEILKGSAGKLPPTSPPATSQGSRNDNILGAI